MTTHFDVIIVGAGLSGIGAAHHLQAACPHKTYAILEARGASGGTWDLFRYPGIRSDSDMYTLGYSFRPWTNPKAIADGGDILSYVRDTAEHAGIDRKVRYHSRVERATWSSKTSTWTLTVKDTKTGEANAFTCNFLFACAGYYDYEEGYTPEFEGRSLFRGPIIHPQKWSNVDYDGKRVVVIGSGATAVTLVPELAKRAAHVTMLQRSPTYIITMPDTDRIADWMRGRVRPEWAYALTRWKNVLLNMAFFAYCRRFPTRAKKFLVDEAHKRVRGKADVADFTPHYNPWDQRVCLVPNGDLFKAIRDGRASVVTDHIERFTEHGIRLKSGRELDADLIVTATGLKLRFLGGMALEVDGKTVELPRTMAYKGVMFSDVPNLAMAVGYTNASWTLKCDLTSEYVCRLLNHMDKGGFTRCVPRRNDPSIQEQPIIDFSSGYVQRALEQIPKQGSASPWKLYQNYALDLLLLRRARLEDGTLEFSR